MPDSDDQISVFLPCTPNPTTGFFFYVPRKKIIELDIPVEAAATLIMSAGMIQPGAASPSETPTGVAALAAQARAAQQARETGSVRLFFGDGPAKATVDPNPLPSEPETGLNQQ